MSEAALRVDVVVADLDDPLHRAGLLEVLSIYAMDPMGGGQALDESVKRTVIDELKQHPTTEVLLALSGERVVGIAVCFVGFSTFRARRLLNLHDLAVLPDVRARGVGRRLLEAVERRARELSCCKLTLEVREHNERARSLYESFGFGVPEAGETRTLFLEKALTPR